MQGRLFSDVIREHLGDADAQLGHMFNEGLHALRKNGGKAVVGVALTMKLSAMGTLEIEPKPVQKLPQAGLADVVLYVDDEGHISAESGDQLNMLDAAGNA